MSPKPVKTKIGHVQCLTPGCDTKIPVRRNDANGSLSFPCIECGAPNYAKNDGSDHYKRTMARLMPLAGAVPAPAPATGPAPPAPVPAAPPPPKAWKNPLFP